MEQCKRNLFLGLLFFSLFNLNIFAGKERARDRRNKITGQVARASQVVDKFKVAEEKRNKVALKLVHRNEQLAQERNCWQVAAVGCATAAVVFFLQAQSCAVDIL